MLNLNSNYLKLFDTLKITKQDISKFDNNQKTIFIKYVNNFYPNLDLNFEKAVKKMIN